MAKWGIIANYNIRIQSYNFEVWRWLISPDGTALRLEPAENACRLILKSVSSLLRAGTSESALFVAVGADGMNVAVNIDPRFRQCHNTAFLSRVLVALATASSGLMRSGERHRRFTHGNTMNALPKINLWAEFSSYRIQPDKDAFAEVTRDWPHLGSSKRSEVKVHTAGVLIEEDEVSFHVARINR